LNPHPLQASDAARALAVKVALPSDFLTSRLARLTYTKTLAFEPAASRGMPDPPSDEATVEGVPAG